MSAETVHLDTNVLIRVITADHAELTPHARRVFDRAARGEFELLLASAVAAEAFYVLASTYAMSRRDAIEAIVSIANLPGVRAAEPDLLLAMIALIQEAPSLKFIDAYVIALAARSGAGVVTFDQMMKSAAALQGVDVLEFGDA